MLMIASALFFPTEGVLNCCYFTVRAGGRTMITMLTDSGLLWGVQVSTAFVISRFTDMPIVQVYFCVQFIDILKVVIGLLMLRSDFWARNVFND